MSSGYEQYFKKAQQVAQTNPRAGASRSKGPKINLSEMPSVKKSLSEKLREKTIEKKREARKRRKFPWVASITLMSGLLVAAYGFSEQAKLEKILKSVEFSLMAVAGAEEAKSDDPKAEAMAKMKPNPAKSEKDDAKADTAGKAASTRKEYSEDEINHFEKINERKLELDAREAELSRLESELAAQKEALEKRLAELESTRRQISSVLQDRVQADDKKVDSLVQVYSSMKPQQAAKIFETMDEDLAIEILGRMKKKPAAEILNLVKAEKAQVLSEKYAGYKRK
jgi:flagellar motility protein MotE (MotC chaperone)